MSDPGWTQQSEVQRYTANLNTTYKILNNLSLNMISNASYRKQRAPGTLSSEIDPVYGEVKRDFDINPYSYALNTSRALDPNDFYVRNYAKFNIMHELDNNYINLNVTDFRIQGELKYKVIPELELSAIGAAKYTASSQEHNILDNSNQAMAYREMGTSTIRNSNPFLYTDPDNPYALPISVLPNGGIYERTDNNMIGYDFRTTANFSKTFADKHIVNLFGGMEINDITRHSTWFRGWGLQYNMGEIPNYAYQVFKQGSEQNANYYTYLYSYDRSAAFFANGTYSYKGRLRGYEQTGQEPQRPLASYLEHFRCLEHQRRAVVESPFEYDFALERKSLLLPDGRPRPQERDQLHRRDPEPYPLASYHRCA